MVNVFWGDPQPAAGIPQVYYTITESSGRLTTLLVDPAVLARAGGRAAIEGQWMMVTGTDQRPAIPAAPAAGPSYFQVSNFSSAPRPAGVPRAPSRQQVSGAQPFITLLCRYADSPQNLSLSPYDVWYPGTAAPGADHYFQEVSGGVVNLNGSRVMGWYDLPYPESYYHFNRVPQFGRLQQDCTAAADDDVNYTQFAGINIQISGLFGCCAFGGQAYLYLEGIGRFYGLTWMPIWTGTWTIAHEMGHTFGLGHSSGPYGQVYDSRWDVMSGAYDQVHTIAAHKELLGWIPSSQVFIPPSGASQAVIGIERGALPPPGSQFLMARIPIPGYAGQYYSVEARERAGYDNTLFPTGVVIHRIDQSGMAIVVDADNNGDPNDQGATWSIGETFRDVPAGIEMTVMRRLNTGYELSFVLGSTPGTVMLNASVSGNGIIVQETPQGGSGLYCPGDCTGVYGMGSTVRLNARTFTPGTAFAGWGGACAGRGVDPYCSLTLNGSQGVSAAFVPGVRLDLSVSGNGAAWAWPSVWCHGNDGQCAGYFPPGSTVSIFTYRDSAVSTGPWGGDCSGQGVGYCALGMTVPRSVTLAFTGGLAMGLNPGARRDTLAAGDLRTRPDSVQLTFQGLPFSWTAASPTPWIQVATTDGQGDAWVRWNRVATGLPIGTHVGAVVVTAPGAYGSPGVLADTLVIVPPPVIQAASAGRRDSVELESVVPVPDSVPVMITGFEAGEVAWSAVTPAPWVTLTQSSGVGPGSLRWERRGAGLPVGAHVATITLSAPGATGSPAVIRDTFMVLPHLTLALSRTGQRTAAIVGSTSLLSDSLDLNLTGWGNAVASWEASHGSAAWLSLTTASGTGPGRIRWTRDPAGLSVGNYLDTIRVLAPGAFGSPVTVIDTLAIVYGASLAVTPGVRVDSATLGSLAVIQDSATVTVSGQLASSTGWTVTHGAASWLEVLTSSGTGSGTVRWRRNSAGLGPGVYVDTVTVAAPEANDSPQRIVDSLIIYEPSVAVSCAASHLIQGPCLNQVQREYLDQTGNRDGRFNLGDLLAYLDRKHLALSPMLLMELLAAGGTASRRSPARERP